MTRKKKPHVPKLHTPEADAGKLLVASRDWCAQIVAMLPDLLALAGE